jgi:hypothetical protein
LRGTKLGQIGVPASVIAIMVMMVVPLPTVLLDLLLVANLAGAVVILLVSMQVRRALDFSIFPSVLLIATLFRLALNVSSTRLVLLHGDAGKVIESFGHFVVGGSLVVGLVIFLILSVIQFIVITNGAGRVAEVGARFTLDAMPGKQMAIDADFPVWSGTACPAWSTPTAPRRSPLRRRSTSSLPSRSAGAATARPTSTPDLPALVRRWRPERGQGVSGSVTGSHRPPLTWKIRAPCRPLWLSAVNLIGPVETLPVSTPSDVSSL